MSKFSGFKLAGVLAVLYFLSGCSTHSLTGSEDLYEKGVQQDRVKLQVTGNPAKIKVMSPPNKNCGRADKEGCIRIGQDSIGLVNFEVSPKNKWVFSSMSICNGGSKPEACKLSTTGMEEFTAIAGDDAVTPDSAGILDLENLTGGAANEFMLIDLNRVKAEYFYDIKICPANGKGECINLDPVLDNGGLGQCC